MSKNGNHKKDKQLGMPVGTAFGRLRKMVLFGLVQKLGLDNCYRCNEKIKSVREFSIEHKEAWLDSGNPKELFFDLENIAFSHLSCNCRYAKNAKKGTGIHPSVNAYKEGCRCTECCRLHTEDYRTRKHRQ